MEKQCTKGNGKNCWCKDCKKSYQKEFRKNNAVERAGKLLDMEEQTAKIIKDKLDVITRLEKEAFETAENYRYTNRYIYPKVECVAATYDFVNELKGWV